MINQSILSFYQDQVTLYYPKVSINYKRYLNSIYRSQNPKCSNLSTIPGYIFERSGLPCIYAAAITLPYYHIEDVFITGFVAEACKIPRVELTGHHPGRINSTQVKPGTDTLMHYITPQEKYNIHKAVITHMFFSESTPI